MRDQPLPEWVDPQRLAEKGRRLTGCLALSSMPRLIPLLGNHEAMVQLDLDFGVNVEGIPYLSGTVQVSLEVECQRCLKKLRLPMDLHLQLAIVDSRTNLDSLAEGYEPLVQKEDPMRLADIVEDELILAIPQVPMHSAPECRLGMEYQVLPESPNGQGVNPFAVLGTLKTK